jgi:hypothetical protein
MLIGTGVMYSISDFMSIMTTQTGVPSLRNSTMVGIKCIIMMIIMMRFKVFKSKLIGNYSYVMSNK